MGKLDHIIQPSKRTFTSVVSRKKKFNLKVFSHTKKTL